MAMKKNVCSTFTGRPTAGSLMSLANLADRRNILFISLNMFSPISFSFYSFWILVPHFLLLWSDILEKGELPVFFILVFFGNKILTCCYFLLLTFSQIASPRNLQKTLQNFVSAAYVRSWEKRFLLQRGMSEISDWKRMAEVCYILWETISWHCDVGIFYYRLISNVQHDWSPCAIKPMHGLYQLLCWLKLIKLLL